MPPNASPDSLDLEHAGAGPLVAALAARQVSSLELCDAAIARIERLDREINAVVVRDFDRAREQARAADAALARGERRPLLGLPMTVKESYDIAGLPTTWGFAQFAGIRAEADALAVTRLKDAGAVILGKTNVPPALGDWQSVNPVYGRTVNPLDPSRSPGGSSGGGAAALASFMVPLELGSDIGGSIRIPAHFCGVFGHKPSLGLLPARGHRLPGPPVAPSTLAVIGPLARSAADLSLAFDVLAGPDEADAAAYRLALRPPRAERLADARLLVIDEHPSAATSRDTRDAVERLAADLAGAGARVARSSGLLPDLAEAHGVYVKMLLTEITRRAPSPGPTISAHEWLALLDRRVQLRLQWAALFRSFDAVIAPVFGTTAFPHDDTETWRDRRLVIDGIETPYGDQLAWPGVATLPGLPATVVPVGRGGDGLPIGVQVIGPALEDRTPLALAAAIEALRR